MSLLLIVSGDIECNPGPRGRGNTNSCSQPTTVHTDVAASTRSRQRTLTSFSSQPSADERRNSVGYPRQNQDQDMIDFLRSMKSDLDSQNARVTRDISQVNTKIDSVSDSINCLRVGNEKLKTENQALRSDIAGLKGQLDTLEGYSRRNNLRINGISGSINEKWSDCENKVRDFIKNDLNLPEKKTLKLSERIELNPGTRRNVQLLSNSISTRTVSV